MTFIRSFGFPLWGAAVLVVLIEIWSASWGLLIQEILRGDYDLKKFFLQVGQVFHFMLKWECLCSTLVASTKNIVYYLFSILRSNSGVKNFSTNECKALQ